MTSKTSVVNMKRGGRRGVAKKNEKKRVASPVKSPQASPGPSRGGQASQDANESDHFSQIGQQSPRTNNRWTVEKERELVCLWQDERHLYDSTAREYRNTRKRQEAYQRFGKELNMDGRFKQVPYFWKVGPLKMQAS